MITKSKSVKKEELSHYPNLNTVIMVEKELENSKESILKITDLKKLLPKKINHNTLKIILEYLEKSNKITVSLKGISWVHNKNPNLSKAINKGLEL